MLVRPRSVLKKRVAFHALATAIAWASAPACGNSPSGPSNNGGGGTASCRTGAASTHSVQTFVDGQVVTTDMTCAFNSATNEVTCQGSFTDSYGGPGTITQTSRFASKGDIVDEASTNPPRTLSLGTTTVTSTVSLSVTITATNSYDAQRRLVAITIDSPVGDITVMYSAWDASGRPTAGTVTLPQGALPVSISYDNANRSSTRNDGLNTCTVTHDGNGIIIRETCTGTTASTTVVTVNSTQSICK